MLPSEQWPPPFAELVAEFVVVGDMKTAGSKVSGVATRFDVGLGRRVPVLNPNTGMPVTFVKDSSGKPGKTWRAEVSSAGLEYRRTEAPVSGRLAAEFVFVYPYKQGDYSKRTGELRDSIRVAPHVRPDALKLGRAVEDALSSVLYEDDAQITEERLRKVHVPPGDGPQRCEVRLWSLPTTFGELRGAQAPAITGIEEK